MVTASGNRKPIFLSHATPDKPFVVDLHRHLQAQGIDTWMDARELVGGNALDANIMEAIENASAMIVVLSPNTINSSWVTKEIQHALKVRQERNGDFSIVPLLLPGITPNALPHWFPDGPLAIPVELKAGKLDAAMPQILAALGKQLPTYEPLPQETPPAPTAELILTLSNLQMHLEDGKRRPRATATLICKLPDAADSDVDAKPYRVTAPLGAIEAGDLEWYLETYFRFPTRITRDRAAKIEAQLPQWGKWLYDAVHKPAAEEAFKAWEAADKKTARCFTVKVESELPEDCTDDERTSANEAATLLLGLPWELMHNGRGYLFEGAKPSRVRRQLPIREKQDVYPTGAPIRVLLVCPRPEDKQARYIDHRVSARPLVEALAPLGSLAQITLLTPPTFQNFVDELKRANDADTPYHIVHFNGHGVYKRDTGLGALVFEKAADVSKLTERGSDVVDAAQIAASIQKHRVPLVFLEACQSAKTETAPTASVAGRLLEGGVASVVAMSHSVLVETARRFVAPFYAALLDGKRIGQAMLDGQLALKNNTYRGKTSGGDLHLHDWFVPVLYQEKSDPQLIAGQHNRATQETLKAERAAKESKLPPTPEHTFVGRSRELLAAERLLETQRYVTLTGEGGEGKTTLAVELARWLVATHRFERAAFVSFEQHQTADAALAFLGEQLVPNYLAQAAQGEGRDWLLVERALREQRTVIVLDNMESVLQPPDGATGAAMFEPKILQQILEMCEKLNKVGETHLVFTSREHLPSPFAQNTIGLGQLSQRDAKELVAQVLGRNVTMPGTNSDDASDAAVSELVNAVGRHARALVLLTNEVKRTGVRNATTQIQTLMQQMDAQFPDNRERSLLASVRLSLNRLPANIRLLIRPLGVFQSGGSLTVIKLALQLEQPEIVQLIAQQLVGVGLAEAQEYGYLRFDPALAPALLSEMTEEEQTVARDRWAEAMSTLAVFLYQQRSSNPHLAFGLAASEMPSLLATLEYRARTAHAADIIQFATSIENLADSLGWAKAIVLASRIRDKAAERLSEWSRTAFNAASAAIDRLLNAGRCPEAIAAAEQLLLRCQTAGEAVYPGAAYDGAIVYAYLGRARKMGGDSGAALTDLAEAERRLERLALTGDANAAIAATVSRLDQAECLMHLGRLSEAASLYEQTIEESEQQNNPRSATVGRGELADVRRRQGRHGEALQAYAEARDTFEQLGEPYSVAVIWHRTGIVYQQAGNDMEAEQAYLEALRIRTQIGDRVGQADTRVELGNLYGQKNRYEEALRFYGEAAVIFGELRDLASEGRVHNNAAGSLLALQRYDEARRELMRAIECNLPFGHVSEPWNAYELLRQLEEAEGNVSATQEARAKAIQSYLAYRRDGGESRDWGGQVVAYVRQALAEGQGEAMSAELAELANRPDMPENRKALLAALQQIVAGVPATALADDPRLYYQDAVELLLLG